MATVAFHGTEHMVSIPGGAFAGRNLVCAPGTNVPATGGSGDAELHVAAFSIDHDVVSCDELKVCERAKVCHPGEDQSYCHSGAAIALISEANEYCAWRHASVPTYAQWQRAIRGVAGKHFPWGEAWKDPGCEKGSADGLAGRRCMYETDGVAFEAGSFLFEWTSDLDCGQDLKAVKQRLPVAAAVGGFELDAEAALDPQRMAEFRCARQVVETPR